MPTPTPIPAFAPVERPLEWLTLEGAGGAVVAFVEAELVGDAAEEDAAALRLCVLEVKLVVGVVM